jgi:pSer/pThr/pTyr-binding forkhead associated (FHA) protein
MPPRLVSLDGHPDIPLDQFAVVVGRHRQCHVRIASPRVSRRHCCLALHSDGVVVRDLGSTNGTRINGRRINEGLLRKGDELSIAHCRYRLEGAPVLECGRGRDLFPDIGEGCPKL